MSDTDHPLTLYALAAHGAGDFPLQPDRMAAEKLDNPRTRAEHVTVYTAAFLPVTVAADFDSRQAAVFLGGIWATHFAVDSRRWNDNAPLWFDQALHVITLALVFAVALALGRET